MTQPRFRISKHDDPDGVIVRIDCRRRGEWHTAGQVLMQADEATDFCGMLMRGAGRSETEPLDE